MKKRINSMSVVTMACMPLTAYGVGTVVNFHIANNSAAGPPTNANIVYIGQGAASDPGNNVWNGAGPGFTANVNGNNTTSTGAATPVTFTLSANLATNGGLNFDGPDGMGGNTHQGSPFFLLGHCTLTNSGNPGVGTSTAPMGQFILNNVPSATYDVYLYGSNYDADRGAIFALNSGTADSGITGTVNAGQGANNSFTLGTNYVVFHNVTPNGSAQIIGTWTPNPASTLQGEGNFNAIQLVAPTNIVIEPEWGVDSAGDWNVAANWIGGIPNGVGAVAKLLTHSTSSHTVYTDTAIALGTLRMENSATYVVAGLGNLSMQVNTGAASVNVTGGSHKINLPLTFVSNTNINVGGGATLTIGNPTTINASTTVTKTGNVLVQAPLTIQSSGKLQIVSGPTTLFGAPTLASGAQVDVTSNTVTIDYHGLSGQAAAINAQLVSGYAGGAWNGSGFNTSSAIVNETALGWKDDATAQNITIKYVRYGDADINGTVDTIDFNALASNFGQSGKFWFNGDFDYNGTVDTIDFNRLAANFARSSPAPSLGALVPEPTGLFAVIGLVAPAMCRRRSRRRVTTN